MFFKTTRRAHPFAFIALAALALIEGCARPPAPAGEIPRVKLLVMDFDVPPGALENEREIVGWWFGARTVYQNPRAGAVMAERLTGRLAPHAFLSISSRVQLRYFLAGLRAGLAEEWPELGAEAARLDELIDGIPDADIARRLGAQKVLSGRIVRGYVAENRTIHIWWAVLEVECVLTDAVTGSVEWRKRYDLKRWFASQFDLQDELARLAARDLAEEYFTPLAESPLPGSGSIAGDSR